MTTDNSVTNVEELAACHGRMRREADAVTVRLIWLLAGWCVIAASTILVLSSHPQRDSGSDLLARVVLPVLLMAGLLAIVVWSVYRASRAQQSLTCPDCHKPLNGIDARGLYLAIATGRCPTCYEFLWPGSEQPARDVASHSRSSEELMSREAFQNALKQSRRRPWMMMLPFLATMGFLALLPLAALPLRRVVQPETGKFMLIGLFQVGSILVLVLTHGWVTRVEDRRGVKCPGCRGPIRRERLVLLTGRCGCCGIDILSDPLPCDGVRRQSAHSMELKTFQERSRRFEKLRMVPLAVLGALTIPCLVLAFFLFGSKSVWAFGLFGSLFGTVAAGCFYGLYRLRKALRCPDCQADLSMLRDFVVASKNCPCCGVNILR